MGGSGGGGGGNGSSWTPSTNNISCVDLKFNVNLSSPDSAALKRIRVGALLDVELNNAQTGCVALFESEVAGSIIHVNAQQLVNCLKSGEIFYARVRAVDGGKCAVQVLHESFV